MDEPKVNGMRKTTKAAIAGSFVLLSIRPLKDLKEFIMGEQIVTNARIEATMKEGFARIEGQVSKHIDDDVKVHNRLEDTTYTQVAASEARCEKRGDKVESRVSNLEVYAFKNLGGKTSKN